MRANRVLPLLVLLALSACAQATEIVLVVDTDFEVPAELTRVEIDVLNSLAAPTRTAVDLTSAGAPPLPLTLGITSRLRGDADVRVEVRGYLETGEILVRDVSTRLGPGSSRMLRVLLSRRCVGVSCGSNLTCDETGCRSVDIAPEDLPAWTGTAPVQSGPACEPADEICNLIDDDCDDVVDETIERLTDPANCGSCAHACMGTCANGFCPGERPVDVSAGGAHTCVRRENGTLACFGWNTEGQLGSSRLDRVALPLAVPGLAMASAISMGGSFGCALDASSRVFCSGDGDDGALGRATTVDGRSFGMVMSAVGFGVLGAGAQHVCAIEATAGMMTGDVYCWGNNASGQCGSVGTLRLPTPVPGLSGASAVAAGFRHSCAVDAGEVRCWGANGRGQLGTDPMMTPTSTDPIPVMGLDQITGLALGRFFSCALHMDGRVLCWGANDFGELGSTGATSSFVPLEVTGIDDAMAITAAVGGTHACALRAGGRVSCWGGNESGQLGNGTTTPSPMPVDVMNVSGAIAVAAGGLSPDGRGHTCIILGSGEVRCTGDGSLGQTGDPMLAAVRSTAGSVPGLP